MAGDQLTALQPVYRQKRRKGKYTLSTHSELIGLLCIIREGNIEMEQILDYWTEDLHCVRPLSVYTSRRRHLHHGNRHSTKHIYINECIIRESNIENGSL